MTIKRKVLSLIISILMIGALITIYLPVSVGAQGISTDNFSGSITYNDGANISLTSNGIEKTGTITISPGAKVTLEIKDLVILNDETSNISCLKLGEGSELDLTLSGNNNLSSYGRDSAAIDSSLGTLNISNTSSGNLNADSTYGAAIGGVINSDGGKININGGTVTATSIDGAGIGGGQGSGSGGTINISGGNITATSNVGSGIGAGSNGPGGTINISGGSINATGGGNGAGIGGAYENNSGAINISGGTVIASDSYNSDIGKGYTGSAGTTKITGGSVNPIHQKIDPLPTNDLNTTVIEKTVALGNSKQSIGGLFFAKPYVYGLKDVLSDANKDIYIWLPSDLKVNTLGDEFPNLDIGNKVLSEINRNTSSISYSMDDYLTKEMVDSVFDLDISHLNLDNNDKNTETSLNNLKYCTGISSLNLSGNKISNILFASELINLNYLYANDNKLEDLPDLSKLVNLFSLTANNNSIASLTDLSKSTNLNDLELNNNKLTTLGNISQLTNLNCLYANCNNLTTLPDFSKLVNLNIADLSGQTLKSELLPINLEKSESVASPILSQAASLVGFKGFEYDLNDAKGSVENITGDVTVDEKGVIIPAKDLSTIGKYTLNIIGSSDPQPLNAVRSASRNSLSNFGYSANYTYQFSVVKGVTPTPVPVPKPMPTPAQTPGVISKIVPITSTDKNNLPKTGDNKTMYLGIVMTIIGAGLFVIKRRSI